MGDKFFIRVRICGGFKGINGFVGGLKVVLGVIICCYRVFDINIIFVRKDNFFVVEFFC